jgi:drug/metabolite transporter (DMT)-like permease
MPTSSRRMTAEPLTEERRTARRAALWPYLLLALASLFWAGNWVIGRGIRDAVPPIGLNFWRWTIAVLVLAPVALPRLRGKGAVLRRHWPVLLLLGAIGAAFFQAMVYTGLRYTETVNAVLMNSAAPLFMMLVAWLMAGDRVSLRQVLGMLVSLFGIVVIMLRGDPMQILHLRLNPGDLLILLAMPTWGVYSVLLRYAPRGIDGISLLFVIATIGVAVLAPCYALERMFVAAPAPGWPAVAGILYVGLFASVAAYICWNRAVALVGANRAGFTMHLLPAFGTLLATLTLGEAVHLFHAVGIATILLGVWLATSDRRA